jgi:hypothetical protein
MSENVCKGILNMRIRCRIEQSRLTSAARESETIFQAAKEQEERLLEEGGGEGGKAEGGGGSSNSAKYVAQAKAMLQKLDTGVGILKVSIMRADETMSILTDFT